MGRGGGGVPRTCTHTRITIALPTTPPLPITGNKNYTHPRIHWVLTYPSVLILPTFLPTVYPHFYPLFTHVFTRTHVFTHPFLPYFSTARATTLHFIEMQLKYFTNNHTKKK